MRKLIDLSRRNNLLYFRDLKVGSLDLSRASTDALTRLLRAVRGDDEGVPLDDLVIPDDRERAAAALNEIAARALSNLEERGLDTLFLGVGLATWPAADGGRPAQAPVLLVPIRTTMRGREARRWALKRAGDVKINDVLVHAMEAQYGVLVEPEQLIEQFSDDEDESFDPEPLFQMLRREAAQVPGFAIERRWTLGNFAFQKLAIVRDLKEYGDQLAAHPLIAAIAGDEQAAAQVRQGRTEDIDPQRFDEVLPDQEFLIRDADATQQRAIASTLVGQNGVISGPPGTGKSQTIANLIAELAARGRPVLFVAEKRAALDVVLNRLRDAGLDHLCLDFHGADTSRRIVAAQLKDSLDAVRQAPAAQTTDIHRQLVERRAVLNQHVRRLHQARFPGQLSLYAIQGRLLTLASSVSSTTRWRGAELQRLEGDAAHRTRALLGEAAGMAGLITGSDVSPWTGSDIARTGGPQEAVDLASRLALDRWPALVAEAVRLARVSGLREPGTFDEIGHLCRLLTALTDTYKRYPTGVFDLDLDDLAQILARARHLPGRWWAWITNPRFRASVRALRNKRFRHVGAATLLAEIDAIRQQRSECQSLAVNDSPPTKPGDLTVLTGQLADVGEDLSALQRRFTGRTVAGMPLGEAQAWMEALARDRVSPFKLQRLFHVENELEGLGAHRLLQEIRARRPSADLWPQIFDHALMSSQLEAILAQDPSLASFTGAAHNAIAEEFRRLDAERLRAAADRVRRAHAERAREIRNQFPQQDVLVGREAEKKTRHLPLRRLVAEAADVLLALRPCWLASPLSVSQLLPGDRSYFDVVLFDEASQVLPEDAVASLLRGRQAVVAGDRQQLPPTTFFAAGDDESGGEEGGAVEGFESVLDQMSAFLSPPWSLDWHYRSRDETLIAFSNHHVYANRLVTFPGPGGSAGVIHHLVETPSAGDRDVESGSAEVARVVSLILEHASQRPTASLGVIAMGIAHARRIEMALDQARRTRPELDEFFSPRRLERFFVKNIERVQGDERDAIILTIGYGKDSTGRLLYRFGPLLMQGGERRLNVAITRARDTMTVVSSFSHHDMDPSRSSARGVVLLRAYLEYAASGGRSLAGGTSASTPLNEFEQAVHDVLSVRGVKLVPQLGASKYRIDFAAQHPRQPGRFVLAIECDGATYHSAPTARDRDRLRQQHLEALGWSFCRIWSTDWFLRQEQEVQRVLAAYATAIERADREPAPTNTAAAHDPVAVMVNAESSPRQNPVARGPRPPVRAGLDIDDYTSAELEAIVRWLASDRLLTDEELSREAVRELGFRRRGSRIDAALRAAIRAVQRQ